eukprot:GHUV01035119.1.p1 GENE.GHUV01035119.1~~GHUV01035119.1.p1  ORF type:complete len:101 (-),score=11.52 GHUV01035119.1:111-413(-)
MYMSCITEVGNLLPGCTDGLHRYCPSCSTIPAQSSISESSAAAFACCSASAINSGGTRWCFLPLSSQIQLISNSNGLPSSSCTLYNLSRAQTHGQTSGHH